MDKEQTDLRNNMILLINKVGGYAVTFTFIMFIYEPMFMGFKMFYAAA